MPTTTTRPSEPTGYDPTSPTPYTPPQLPEITPSAGTQAAEVGAQMQRPQSEAPRVAPGQRGSKAAGIAYMASRVLKGFAVGRTQADIVKTARMKRTLDGLKMAYDGAAQKYADMKRRGVTGPELDQAKSAVDASWAAMMKFYGQYFEEGGQKPKGAKGKKGVQAQGAQGAQGGQAGDAASPLMGLMSQDPKEKAAAWYKIALQNGPPVYVDSSMYETPEYKQQQELGRAHGKNELDIENKRLRLHELQGKGDQLDEKGKEELRRLEEDPELFPMMSKPDKKISDYVGKDGKKHLIMERPNGERYETLSEGDVRQGTKAPSQQWTKLKNGQWMSQNIDPYTNQVVPGTVRVGGTPPAALLPHIREGEFGYVDADNKIHRQKYSVESGVIVPTGTEETIAMPTGGAPGAPATGGGAPPLTPAPAHAPETAPGAGAGGDRVVGDKGPTGQTKSRSDAADSIIPLIARARKLMADPEVQAGLGPLAGRWSDIEKKIGNLSGKTRELAGVLMSIYSLGGTMHGWRSIKVAENFAGTYGDLTADPSSLLGGLRAMEGTAKEIYKTGYKKDWAPHTKPHTSVVHEPTGGGSPGGSAPKTADDYLKTLIHNQPQQ